MATSGTATFQMDLAEIVEEAFERAGAELRSGYDLRTARRSMNLLLAEWANRGVNLWTMDSGAIALVAGTATYALPADTVDIFSHVLRTDEGVAAQSDLSISRISAPTYAVIPNKLAQGRPIQLWVQRLGTPQITLYPVPDVSSTYQLVYWRLRRMQDATSGVNTMDVPFRFLPALIAGLAYYLALKIPGGLDRLPLLKAQYDEAFDLASQEDREKAALRLVPRMSYV